MSDRNRGGRRPENHYCGMLIIRKEPGYTSSDVVAKLRGILHMRRIGHTGTLDPMAEGVLPVCLGNATKLTELIADRDKEYIARLRLGVITDTQDMTGTVLEEKSADEVRQILCRRSAAAQDGSSADTAYRAVPDDAEEEELIRERIRVAAASFVGEIRQVPPMYSAVWSNGQRLYELARKGVTVDREPRIVTVTELEIQAVELPYVTFRVVCSKGTYIRTLCEDLGNALGTGGAMDHLLRTRVGTFTLEDALTLDGVRNLMEGEPAGHINNVGEVAGQKDSAKGVPVQADDAEALADIASPGNASSPEPMAGRALQAGPLSSEHKTHPTCPEPAAGIAGRDCIENHIVPVDRFFAGDPQIHVRDEDLRFLKNGNALSGANTVEGRLPRAERIRVYDAHGEFYALYRYEKSRRRALPVKMFHDTESLHYDK